MKATKSYPWYVSTAIPYVNARPHIGFALELVQADVFARYQRAIGKSVYFLTGSDENSLKNVLAAEEEGISVTALVERNAQYFIDLVNKLGISNDDFIRTGREVRHRIGAQQLWVACFTSGDIYKKSYGGLYCVGCEQFYSPEELVEGRCPEHGTVPEWVEEENYFFRLSKYQDPLFRLIDTDRLRIFPVGKKNEVLSFIEMGLQDFSISRSRQRAHGWGIEVPDDPSQVMYVWFDALANYITALDYGTNGPKYQRYWVNAETRRHVVGKGIIRFHAVYWPAILLSATVPLPTELFVHGYLTINGQKISKSLGNIIDPFRLISDFGADAVRYYLLRQIPATNDADFSMSRFIERYNADLADDLGNLLQRSISMIHRYRQGLIPSPEALSGGQVQWAHKVDSTTEGFIKSLDSMELHTAIQQVWQLVSEANKYVVISAPWVLAKRVKDVAAMKELDTVLYNLVELARVIGAYLYPLLPAVSQSVMHQVGIGESTLTNENWLDQLRWGLSKPGTYLPTPQPLFPKIQHSAKT